MSPTRFVVFQESLHGLVRPVELDSTVDDDRLECAVAAESVLDDNDGLAGCVLADLRIAVDVGTETVDGALAGPVRSGRVHVEGMPILTVHNGEFELFPRVSGDARRMRYRLWLRDPAGTAWFLRGTKLVVNEVGAGRIGRMWAETTTLYIVLFPFHKEPDTPSEGPVYAGVVRVHPVDLVRQLASVRGEPGPTGGLRAVGRLGAAFWSVLAEVYLRGGSTDFAPGIEAAFGPPPDDR
jgi:hypothetical protein